MSNNTQVSGVKRKFGEFIKSYADPKKNEKIVIDIILVHETIERINKKKLIYNSSESIIDEKDNKKGFGFGC